MMYSFPFLISARLNNARLGDPCNINAKHHSKENFKFQAPQYVILLKFWTGHVHLTNIQFWATHTRQFSLVDAACPFCGLA